MTTGEVCALVQFRGREYGSDTRFRARGIWPFWQFVSNKLDDAFLTDAEHNSIWRQITRHAGHRMAPHQAP